MNKSLAETNSIYFLLGGLYDQDHTYVNILAKAEVVSNDSELQNFPCSCVMFKTLICGDNE